MTRPVCLSFVASVLHYHYGLHHYAILWFTFQPVKDQWCITWELVLKNVWCCFPAAVLSVVTSAQLSNLRSLAFLHQVWYRTLNLVSSQTLSRCICVYLCVMCLSERGRWNSNLTYNACKNVAYNHIVISAIYIGDVSIYCVRQFKASMTNSLKGNSDFRQMKMNTQGTSLKYSICHETSLKPYLLSHYLNWWQSCISPEMTCIWILQSNHLLS